MTKEKKSFLGFMGHLGIVSILWSPLWLVAIFIPDLRIVMLFLGILAMVPIIDMILKYFKD
jgi:hypothetical protein